MKEFLKSLLLYICIFIFGLSLIIWSEDITDLISIGFGAITIIYSLTIFIDYIRKETKNMSDNFKLIFGIITLVLGIVLITRTDFLKELISFIIGIYVVITSLLKLLEIISIKKETGINNNSGIIISLIEIIVGILCICGKFIVPNMFIKFMGIMLIIYSVLSITNLILIKRK